MKLVNKKIYCPVCRRLVSGKEQVVEGHSQVSCYRCGTLLWSMTASGWKPMWPKGLSKKQAV
jgi:hypothetical protein